MTSGYINGQVNGTNGTSSSASVLVDNGLQVLTNVQPVQSSFAASESQYMLGMPGVDNIIAQPIIMSNSSTPCGQSGQNSAVGSVQDMNNSMSLENGMQYQQIPSGQLIQMQPVQNLVQNGVVMSTNNVLHSQQHLHQHPQQPHQLSSSSSSLIQQHQQQQPANNILQQVDSPSNLMQCQQIPSPSLIQSQAMPAHTLIPCQQASSSPTMIQGQHASSPNIVHYQQVSSPSIVHNQQNPSPSMIPLNRTGSSPLLIQCQQISSPDMVINTTSNNNHQPHHHQHQQLHQLVSSPNLQQISSPTIIQCQTISASPDLNNMSTCQQISSPQVMHVQSPTIIHNPQQQQQQQQLIRTIPSSQYSIVQPHQQINSPHIIQQASQHIGSPTILHTNSIANTSSGNTSNHNNNIPNGSCSRVSMTHSNNIQCMQNSPLIQQHQLDNSLHIDNTATILPDIVYEL